eukprot:scaffold305165_cov40-Tisochrysis_lutea.AAC.3
MGGGVECAYESCVDGEGLRRRRRAEHESPRARLRERGERWQRNERRTCCGGQSVEIGSPARGASCSSTTSPSM